MENINVLKIKNARFEDLMFLQKFDYLECLYLQNFVCKDVDKLKNIQFPINLKQLFITIHKYLNKNEATNSYRSFKVPFGCKLVFIVSYYSKMEDCYLTFVDDEIISENTKFDDSYVFYYMKLWKEIKSNNYRQYISLKSKYLNRIIINVS